MRVNEFKFMIGESETKITLFPFEKEIKSKNVISVLIGKNGTFKSSSLKFISDYFRKSKVNSGSVEGIGTPSKIIAMSSTSGDKFALSRHVMFPAMLYQKNKTDLNYFYFGPKHRAGYSNLAQIRQLMDAAAFGMSSQKSRAIITHVFNDLDLFPSLEFVFTPAKKYSTLSDKETKKEIHEILEKKLESNIKLQKRLEKQLETLDFQEKGIRFIWDFRKEENYSDMLSLLYILMSKKQLHLTELMLSKSDLTKFNINQLSSGEASLLLKFFSLAAVIEDESLILIDEPENSLHPNWQITFLSHLKQTLSSLKGCHVIIATHSPHILSSFESNDGAVVELKREKNTVTGNPLDFGTYGWPVEKILLDVFGLATTRNYYFEMRLRKLLKEIRSESPSKKNISELVSELARFTTDSDDPLMNVLNEARKYM